MQSSSGLHHRWDAFGGTLLVYTDFSYHTPPRLRRLSLMPVLVLEVAPARNMFRQWLKRGTSSRGGHQHYIDRASRVQTLLWLTENHFLVVN